MGFHRVSKNILISVAAAVLVLAAVACAFPLTGQTTTPPTQAPPTALPVPSDTGVTEQDLLINLYQRVSPGVVYIDVSVNQANQGAVDFASGSGFVYDNAGHIVTNNHVIDGADEIRITFSDGLVVNAQVTGFDTYSDLAVLQVNVPDGYQLVPLELGDSNTIQVGQEVAAIGNPFGLSGTMTVGIVSAVGRRLDASLTSADPNQRFSNPLIIQTDAAINPGNSGGPLLDLEGHVLGINTAIRSETGNNTGIGFAVPVNTIKRVIPQIIDNGVVDYPYLGITSNTAVTLGELALEFDIPVTQGVLVTDVLPGTAAEAAGLQGGTQTTTFRGNPVVLGGDIITAINGSPLRTFDDLLGWLVSNASPGDTITLTVYRDGQPMDVSVTLGSRNDFQP